MNKTPEFPEYATIYSKKVRPLRNSLPASLRQVLDKIEDELAENPDKNPRRNIPLTEDIFIYKNTHPNIEITYKIDHEKKIIYILHIVAPMLEMAKSLFISYSHKDEKWLLELKKWLKPLEHQDLITIWDDKELKAGDDWRDKIEKALACAKAAVLLISQDFLSSDFIVNNELPPILDSAKKKGLTIFWIAVSASSVEDTEIMKYQAVLKEPTLDSLNPAEQKKKFLYIYNKIKEVIKQ